MTRFSYNGHTYQAQIEPLEWYNSNNLVRLPDGTILQPGKWDESSPPVLVTLFPTRLNRVHKTMQVLEATRL